MKHLVHGRKFGRRAGQRKAFLKGLTRALIARGRIETTVERAKETRRIAEKLVTIAKKDSLANRRRVIRWLDKDLCKKLFTDISPRYKERPGGYTRITRTGSRAGDQAEKAVLEFV